MAIDGILLSLLREELMPLCGMARVDKIYQPARETLILALRHRGGVSRLLLCAGSQSPRVHLTAGAYENPSAPPMFCMLLRKHLLGAKLVDIGQVGLDRILLFCFENRNELGDPVKLRLAVEIMGRHSNLILVDGEGRILDAVKRVDPAMSSVRQVLPGMAYALPPQQDKVNLLADGAEAAAARMAAQPGQPVHKAALGAIMGISPVVAGEIAGYALRGAPAGAGTMEGLGGEGMQRLRFYLQSLAEKIRAGGTPTMLLTREGAPKDLSFIPITQYQGVMGTREYESYSALIDAFYAEKDLCERIHQRSGDLFRLLANLSERIERKLQHQREELLQAEDRERLRVRADLINANLYRIAKGDTVARVENYYDPGCPTVEIPLDARLTPAQNAQRCYAQYRKADTAERMLRSQIGQAEAEYAYIGTVMDNLMRATCEAELEAVREELVQGGYLRRRAGREKRPKKLEPLKYRSSDGFTILQGRGNVQNDRLTMKEARKNDVWLHTQNIPGSHVIVVSEGRRVPERTLEEAAIIAAYNSKAKNSALVPVDYTEVKNVRKPAGARPGFVLYVNYKTAVVTPDKELVQRLLET